jgi:prolyl 4-hydroxylase
MAQYMKGDSFTLGNCRAACKLCEVCADGDKECRRRNRVAAGYLPLIDDEQ